MFYNKRPLILLFATAVSSLLVAQQSVDIFTAYASESSPYESGRDHSCDDARISDPDDARISDPDERTKLSAQGYR
jgi:hypothetical protein